MNSVRGRIAGSLAAGILLAFAGAANGQGGAVQVRDRAEPVVVPGEPGQPVSRRVQREPRIATPGCWGLTRCNSKWREI